MWGDRHMMLLGGMVQEGARLGSGGMCKSSPWFLWTLRGLLLNGSEGCPGTSNCCQGSAHPEFSK